MKKHFYLYMALLMAVMNLSLNACGDDNDEPIEDLNFVGTWSFVKFYNDEAWGITTRQINYLQVKSDGSCIIVESNDDEDLGSIITRKQGDLSQDELKIQLPAGPFSSERYIILKIIVRDRGKMIIRVYYEVKFNGKWDRYESDYAACIERVDDNVINKYLN